MVVFKTARSLLKILNAELTPTQVAIGFCCGIAAGLVPFGAQTFLFFSVALLLNCSFSGALLFFPLFKLLSFPLAPVSYTLGRWLLDGLSFLDPLWNHLFHWPLIALMDYPRYLISGSYVLAFFISLPVFFVIRGAVERYRHSWLQRLEGRLESARVFRALRERSWLFRIIEWAVGGRVYFREKAPSESRIFRILRKESLWAIPAVYLLVLLTLALVIPLTISQIVARAATYLIGGDVAVYSARFNSLNGRLVLPKLIVQNPTQKAENILVIDDLTLDLDLPALLSKRLVINEASVREVAFNIRRESDGSLNLSHLETGQDFSQYFDWLAQEAQKVDWIKLIKAYLNARFNSPHLDELAPYAGARNLPGYTPAFVLEKLKIGRVHLTLADESHSQGALPAISMIELSIDELSWDASLTTRPVRVKLVGTLDGMPEAHISWTASFEEYRAHREFKIEFSEIELAPLRALYEKSIPVVIANGQVSLTAQMSIDGSNAQGSANLLINNLRLESSENLSLFGLPTEASKAVIDGINHYTRRCPMLIEFPISGTWEAPHFDLEAPVLEIAKQGLLWAGQSLLFSGPLSEIDEKLKQLASENPDVQPAPTGSNPLHTIFDQLLRQTGTPSLECPRPKSP